MFVVNVTYLHENDPLSLALVKFFDSKKEEFWKIIGPFSGYELKEGRQIPYVKLPIKGNIIKVPVGEIISEQHTKYPSLTVKEFRIIYEYLANDCDFEEYEEEEEKEESIVKINMYQQSLDKALSNLLNIQSMKSPTQIFNLKIDYNKKV